MVSSRHSLSKAILYAVIVIALCSSSGMIFPARNQGKSYDSGLLNPFFYAEANDTCAYEIMEKYDCEEVGCTDQANYINYLYLQNCTPEGAHVWFSFLWIFILVLLLCLLASTADDYFCVVMDSVVDKLKIPPSVAGVTFLAFGNGAPDVFSLIISVMSGMTEIGVGANVGAGTFVTTVVAGCVAVFSNCEVNRRAFLRDSIFYLCCIIYLIFVFFDKHITIWEGIGFICLYIVYICIVFINGGNKKHKKEEQTSLLDEVDQATKTGPTELFSPGSPSIDGKEGTGMQISAIIEAKRHDEPADLLITELVQKQSPKPALEEVISQAETPKKEMNRGSITDLWMNAWDDFKERSVLQKILYIIQYPITLLRDMSTPIVEEDRWNKYWLLFSSFGAPYLFAVFAGMDLSDTIGESFPYWALFLIISIVFLLCNIFFTRFEEPPKGFYMVVLVLVGFVLSVLWISAVANELVSLLNAIGLILNISPVILGLTILAWGNSLGDLVADISLSRQGYPQMAIGGVFAAPMFNMLVGMGSAIVIMCIKSKTTDLGADTANINLTFIFLITSVLSSIIMVPLKNYKFTKGYGIYLFCLYGVYLVLNILIVLNVITIPWITPK